MSKWFRYTLLVVFLVGVGAVARFLHLSATFDPDERLSTVDASIVYMGHLTMVGGGYVFGMPEVATEALYLHFPEKNTVWFSDFPAQSPRVQAKLKCLRTRLDSGQDHARTRVVWPRYTWENMRHGLALNTLTVAAFKDKEDGTYKYGGYVSTQYPRRGTLTIGHPFGIPIQLEEGLYRRLQERGWLHPYTAEWYWTDPIRPR
jgi:hypothetical protein